jgi:hypothetical protein
VLGLPPELHINGPKIKLKSAGDKNLVRHCTGIGSDSSKLGLPYLSPDHPRSPLTSHLSTSPSRSPLTSPPHHPGHLSPLTSPPHRHRSVGLRRFLLRWLVYEILYLPSSMRQPPVTPRRVTSVTSGCSEELLRVVSSRDITNVDEVPIRCMENACCNQSSHHHFLLTSSCTDWACRDLASCRRSDRPLGAFGSTRLPPFC